MVQTKLGNVVRETKDVKVKGEGWRARQWTGVRLNKAGDWTVNIMRGDQVLKTLSVKVL
jgi:IS4 transposase